MIHFSRLVQRHRKIVTWLLLVPLAALTLITDSAWPAHHPVHETAEALALFLLVAGVLVRLIATAFIGGRKSEQVMNVGPYSLVRNPLYIGSLLIVTAAGLSFGSVLLALIYCVVSWALFTCLIVAEEAYLRDQFGSAYIDYAARTPRWIPRSLTCAAPGMWMFDVQAVLVAAREGLAFFALVPLEEAIEWAHMAGLLPVLIRLH